MFISIISTSTRAESQSLKVSNFLHQELQKKDVESIVIDLHALQLPFYDDSDVNPIWDSISPTIEKSDGYIFVSPEWNGAVSPAFSNFLLYPDSNIIGHKPALIVSVSSGRGGAMPINQMRQTGYKNTRIVYLPEHLLVRHVKEVLNGREIENKNDEIVRSRARYCLDILVAYAKSMKELRDGFDFRFDEFENGMS